MFELEKDDRIRGIDKLSTALAMAFAHDFILEVMLTREMRSLESDEAALLSRLLVERWQRRYGAALTSETESSTDEVRQAYATKAFVDRLARKALRRSTEMRPEAEVNLPGEIAAETKQAGVNALLQFKHLPPEELVTAIYRAMSNASSGRDDN